MEDKELTKMNEEEKEKTLIDLNNLIAGLREFITDYKEKLNDPYLTNKLYNIRNELSGISVIIKNYK